MQSKLNAGLEAAMRKAVVVPVLMVDGPEIAVPLAQALVRGGLGVIEITLRTPGALAATTAIAKHVPDATVGAGTVRNPEQAKAAMDAGARFLVSPGMTPALIEAAQRWSVPYLPGAATPSEAMALAELGYTFMKFFPAEPAGGVKYLQALASPLPDIRFCPTGSIDAAKAATYLALGNVVCVGGSWVAPADAVKRQDWATIERLAQEIVALRA